MIDPVLKQLQDSVRPLLICDIDEVVLEFLDPFQEYLLTEDYRLHPDSYRLTGNIRSVVDNIAASEELLQTFQERFFSRQDLWQRPAADAKSVLDRLAGDADIVFLTAMPPRHRQIRRELLDSLELRYPMIATEAPKGPVVQALIGDRGVKGAFIDDIYVNLHSVRAHVPNCLLVNLMANAAFRAMAPDPGENVHIAEDWRATERLIRDHFGLAL